MRAIWSGSVSFGLVNVPVKLYGATTSHDIEFHQVHAADGGRIRYERRCEVCGKRIDYGDIDKAYDDGEQTVVLDETDFEELPAAEKDEIEVVQFVPADQIDLLMLQKPYYLEPVGKSPKSYLLLRETLEESELTAIVRFSLRQKTRLGALRARGKVLMLQGLLWADEVREVDFPAVKSRAKVSDKELRMAAALVDQFAGDFHPEEFHDDYQEELRELIDEKLEQGDSVDTEATHGERSDQDADADEGAEVIDLMAALEQSLARRRGADATGSATSAGKSGSKTGSKTAASGAKSKSKTTAKTKSGATSKASGTSASPAKSRAAGPKRAAKSAPKRKSA